jgi:uncharacterized LabA/DUF88 family protein
MVSSGYVDNSNLSIEGMRISAVRKGLASSIEDAVRRNVVDYEWTYDFDRLHGLICPAGIPMAKPVLFASQRKPQERLWRAAGMAGFEVVLFNRNGTREKQVDTEIACRMLDDSVTTMNAAHGDKAVLLSGDSDHLPAVRRLANNGIATLVLFWEHATSAELRSEADFMPLDPFFDLLTRR